jgi:hypothetical protein
MPASVIRSVRVNFRSEIPTKKVGTENVLLLTTRALNCCDGSDVPAKIVGITNLDHHFEVEHDGRGWRDDIPSGTPGAPGGPPAPPGEERELAVSVSPWGMRAAPAAAAPSGPPNLTARAANELGEAVVREAQRMSDALHEPSAAPALDQEFLLKRLVKTTLASGSNRVGLLRPAASLGLHESQLRQLGRELGREDAELSRYDVLRAPISKLEEVVQGSDVLPIHLEAIGLPVVREAAPEMSRDRRDRKSGDLKI